MEKLKVSNFPGKYRKGRSALYFKAQEIMHISRRISFYLTPELSSLNEKGAEHKYIYVSGDIVRHSSSLLMHIDKAESENFQDLRIKYISSVSRITESLFKNCEHLENVNSNGREFLQLLKKELLKFRKLQRTWKLSL